jgi:hypothetical protein
MIDEIRYDFDTLGTYASETMDKERSVTTVNHQPRKMLAHSERRRSLVSRRGVGGLQIPNHHHEENTGKRQLFYVSPWPAFLINLFSFDLI